ncbi:class IIb bacteriocin, lactobin A/cerein 7B family [Clostridium sp.]|uniref:class IIb bacteriocin, lactobin A/cerein 7B family n=1 Tax=Clostridium sp. TaxID=1506 RepID=UPI003D6CDF87
MTNVYDLNSIGFDTLSKDEMLETNGGVFPVLFVIWGISVTVGHCLAAGATLGLVAGSVVAIKN